MGDVGKKRYIELVFKTDGTSNIETMGFTGDECKLASKPFEEALGTVVSEVVTAEGRARLDPIKVKNQVKNTLG
jgi:hypothetical protein